MPEKLASTGTPALSNAVLMSWASAREEASLVYCMVNCGTRPRTACASWSICSGVRCGVESAFCSAILLLRSSSRRISSCVLSAWARAARSVASAAVAFAVAMSALAVSASLASCAICNSLACSTVSRQGSEIQPSRNSAATPITTSAAATLRTTASNSANTGRLLQRDHPRVSPISWPPARFWLSGSSLDDGGEDANNVRIGNNACANRRLGTLRLRGASGAAYLFPVPKRQDGRQYYWRAVDR
jgi:hypothetical protein